MSEDWRRDVLASLPEHKRAFRIVTFKSAQELIEEAAYNRRMFPEDYAGRAALAVAAYDLEKTWALITKGEPPLRDIRRHNLPPKRLYGRNFGPWTIERMS
jgi:hypothetical protein